MSVTHTVTRSYRDQGPTAIQLAEQVTADVEKNIDLALSIGTDFSIPFTLDRTKLKSLVIYSDVALTLETNSSSSATDSIVLVAGQALMWTLATDGLGRCPITANVTALFATNVAAAAFKLRALLSN